MASDLSLSLLLLLAAIGAAAWYAVGYLCAPSLSPREPPLLTHPIPFIGHILGLLRNGTRYYEMTRSVASLTEEIDAEFTHPRSAKCNLPIYTLNMLSGKVYVVTSPDLINAVNRNSKKIAFNPFVAMLGKRITGHDEETSRIVQHNLNGEHGSGYVIDVHDRIVASLAPGKDLQETTKAMISQLSAYFDAVEPDADLNLFEWTRYTMTMCSTTALYGSDNPFHKNPNFMDSFW